MVYQTPSTIQQFGLGEIVKRSQKISIFKIQIAVVWASQNINQDINYHTMIQSVKLILKSVHSGSFPFRAVRAFSTSFNAKIDYFKVLDIGQYANEEEIKSAFHKKAKELHPDLNPQNQEKFKLVNEAYKVLSNENLKRQYTKIRESIEEDQKQLGKAFYQEAKPKEKDPVKQFWDAHISYINAKRREAMNTHISRQYSSQETVNQSKSRDLETREEKDAGRSFKIILRVSAVLTAIMVVEVLLKYRKYKKENKI